MIFGAVPLSEASGAILAHSVRIAGGVLKKGIVLTQDHLDALAGAGVARVTVARLETDDVPEDMAAQALAEAACGPGLRRAAATTGRCNLYAEAAGLLRVDGAAVAAANGIDEALTLATPPDHARLAAGQLAATAKVIPYAAPRPALDRATAALAGALALHPFRPLEVAFIVTETGAQKASVLEKGIRAVGDRLVALGSVRPAAAVVAHDEAVLTGAIEVAMAAGPDLLLILAATATSDRRDVAPAALVLAGGVIERFGMPVDPGNLLVLGRMGEVPAIVLPGCARSPALNGADWVLERLAARVPVTAQDIAAMGVGGLLKEMPGRPHPRESHTRKERG